MSLAPCAVSSHNSKRLSSEVKKCAQCEPRIEAVAGAWPPFTADSSTFEAAHLDQSNRHLLHRRENVAASYKVHHMMMHAQAHRAHNLQWVSVIPRDRYAMRYPARRFASLSALPMPYAEMVSCPPPCAAGG